MLLVDHDAELARTGGDPGRAEVRIGVAVARRVRRAEQVVGVEIGAEFARRRRVEQLHVHAELALQRHATPRHGQLVFGGDQDEIAVLAKVRIHAELGLEPLVGDDAVRRQLDAEPVGVLMTDPAAGQRRRSRADRIALEHDDSPGAKTGQMIGGAHAHDPRADDHDLRSLRHGARHDSTSADVDGRPRQAAARRESRATSIRDAPGRISFRRVECDDARRGALALSGQIARR